ncbi:MAG: GNAT family N-acetyltransferase [Lachnospiraceae bacterium]|nr:GNAT family N-acetyltransferase [Lachnospiraceae bacterium]
MVDKAVIESELKHMLALDFNCDPDDFDKKENIIVLPKEHPGRREYTPKKAFFSMITMGKNTVINAPEELHEWLGNWCKGREGIWLFEHHNLMELEGKLSKYGKSLWQSHHMFLPKARMEEVDRNFDLQRDSREQGKQGADEDVDVKPADTEFEIQWFEQADIQPLYGKEEFPNALCDCFKPERPDVLAVGAVHGGQIVGLAGCSADTKLFWQIGIDVLPEWRGKGIATMLVKLLKNEVFRRGAIPFYGTSLSNLGSWHVALGSGFYPAWVEIATKDV